MSSAIVRLYGSLNDFVPPERRHATLVCAFAGTRSVKDLVEAVGVPHPEVDLLMVNGDFAGFARLVRDGDRVAAYPPFRDVDLGDVPHLAPPRGSESRFLADVHLGRLAVYLRLAGIDTAYRPEAADHDVVDEAVEAGRTILTRDVGLLRHRRVTRGYFVRETNPVRQLVEVLDRFDLLPRALPFSRCLPCNGELRTVPKDRIEDLLPELTRAHYHDFRRCADCGRVYWEGSHYTHLRSIIDAAFATLRDRREARLAEAVPRA